MAKNKLAEFLNKNKWLLLILLLGFLISISPSLRFDMPVVQTDGASYFNYAKVYAETGNFNAPNPEWNKIDSLEEKVSDYPPFFTMTMGFLVRYFGNDVFWINGFYLGIFFVLANVFVYLLVIELTKGNKNSKKIALLVTLFSVLNVRAYYTMFTGQFPAFLGFCFTVPALYFTIKYIRENRISQLIWTLVFVLLAGLSYMQQPIFIITLQIFIFIGYLAGKNLKIKWPEIKTDVRQARQGDFKRMLYVVIPSIIIFLAIMVKFAFGASGRASFVSGWISSLMQPIAGYQAVWQKFFITDGPLLVLFAIFGLACLIYKNEWELSSLLLGGLAIVAAGYLFIAGEPFVKVYVYRFYVFFYILIAISASVLLVQLLENKNVKKLFKVLLLLCIAIEVLKLAIFYSLVGPAISQEEYSVSQFLLKDSSANVLYVHDFNDGNFRSFKWVVVYARSENYDVLQEIPVDLEQYKYAVIMDKTKPAGNTKQLNDKKLLANGEKVQVYQIH